MAKPNTLTEFAVEQELNRNRLYGRWNLERKKCTLCGKPIFRRAKCSPAICAGCESEMPLEDFIEN